MSKESRRLGRGLQSLISPTADPPATSPRTGRLSEGTSEHDQGTACRVPFVESVERAPEPVRFKPVVATETDRALLSLKIEQIRPRGSQPRKSFDAASIASLGESIKRRGIVQPLVVRPSSEVAGTYELVAGERRWRAARAAGVKEVPAIVRTADEREAAELSLIENIQREDLNPIDRAEAYQSYCDLYGVTPDEVGRRLGEDRTTIVNYLRLNELPESVKEWVKDGRIGMGHARGLLGIPTAAGREKLAREVVEKALSVRAVEQAVRDWKANRSEPKRAAAEAGSGKRPQIGHLEEQLQQAVGTKVTIREGRRRGSGKIIIEYYNLDDFDRIAERLGLGAS